MTALSARCALFSLAVALAAILLTTMIVAGGASASSAQGGVRFTVVKRAADYVVVKRHALRLTIRRDSRVVKVGGAARYEVVERTRTFYVLKRLTTSADPPPPASPAIWNVADYGALGNGVTDDAGSIDAAVEACAAAGGGTVFLPAGTYRLVQGTTIGDVRPLYCNIPIASGVTIQGAGIGQTVLQGEGISSCSVFGAVLQTNVGVRDLSIVMPAAEHETTGKDGIKLEGVTYGAFTNVSMENMYIATNCVGCRNITYTGCVATGAVQGFSITLNPETAYATCGSITLTDCEASSSDQCGFYAFWNDGNDTHRVASVTFNGCYAHDNAYSGFYSNWSTHCTWRDCVSDHNSSWGFYLERSKGFLVTSCRATGNGETGFAYPNGSTRRH